MAEAPRNQLPSGYDEDFVNAVEDEILCLICHLPLKEPVLTRCGHRFCKDCLEEHFRRQGIQDQPLTCPADREGLDRAKDVFPDKATERKILSLAIKCPSDGCDWTGELRNNLIHLTSCLFKLVSCTNENCHVTMQRKDLENHVMIKCPWRILECDHCSEQQPECQMQDHIEQCSKFPVSCPNHCGVSIPRDMWFLNDDDSANLPDRQESSTLDEITKRIEELRRRREELNQAFIRWIPKRRHTIEQLEELATKLHEHHRNVNISTVAASSMGTVGGILAIAGLIAAPFTLGAGLMVSLVGAGVGGAGGLVMAGTKLAEVIVSKVGVNAVQQAIGEDTNSCIGLQQQLDELESFTSDLAVFIRLDAVMRKLEASGFEFLHGQFQNLDYMNSAEERVDFGARFFRIIMSAASGTTGAVAAAGAMARGVAMAGTRAAHIAGAAVGAAFLPLDIMLLVKSSLELHRGSTSNAVKEIRKILDELECPEENEIEELLERFTNEKFTEAYNRIDGEKEQPRSDEDHDQDDN